MIFTSRTLKEAQYEVILATPNTVSPLSKPILFHYTNNDSKQKIVDEEKKNVNFKLTKASKFLDKNEGVFILEPYLHACGCLYNENKIDKAFFALLISIGKPDIIKASDPWVLCLSADGCSPFMKERYAPQDGWQVALHTAALDELDELLDEKGEAKTNLRVELVEVKYSYTEMKQHIQETMLSLYNIYQNDNSLEEKSKRAEVKHIIIDYLSMHNFCYKSAAYKKELETRLIIYIKQPFDHLRHPNDTEASLYFCNNDLFLKLGSNGYSHSTQTLDVFNCMELNKCKLTDLEIKKELQCATAGN